MNAFAYGSLAIYCTDTDCGTMGCILPPGSGHICLLVLFAEASNPDLYCTTFSNRYKYTTAHFTHFDLNVKPQSSESIKLQVIPAPLKPQLPYEP